MSEHADQFPEDPQLPPRLASDLSRLYSTRTKPFPSVDATIRLAVAAHFHRQFGRRRLARRIVAWSGAAAAIAAVVTISMHVGLRTQAPAPAPYAMHASEKEDLNHDGKVDILDAFYLARQLKQGQTDPAWDINGDGVVDQRDVDAIAMRGVALGRRGVQ